MFLTTLITAVSALGAVPAPEEAVVFSPPPLVQADVELPRPAPSVPHFGVSTDVGVPEGVGASLLLRPWSWLRLSAGGMTNSISPGVRGGICVVPFRAVVAPSFSGEVGRFADGDANGTAAKLFNQPGLHSDALAHFGYSFASLQLGLEMGSPDRWSIFLRAGMSYVQPSHALEQGMQQVTAQVSQSTFGFINLNAPQNLWMPSAELGLAIYLL